MTYIPLNLSTSIQRKIWTSSLAKEPNGSLRFSNAFQRTTLSNFLVEQQLSVETSPPSRFSVVYNVTQPWLASFTIESNVPLAFVSEDCVEFRFRPMHVHMIAQNVAQIPFSSLNRTILPSFLLQIIVGPLNWGFYFPCFSQSNSTYLHRGKMKKRTKSK